MIRRRWDNRGAEVRHTQFLLYNTAPAPESIFEGIGGIRVYSTADFAGYDGATQQLQQLQMLVAQQPDLTPFLALNSTDASANNLPFMPGMPAAQVIRAHVHYFSSAALQGISYVTFYSQGLSPFTSSEFLYTFQGLSRDGAYYVSAIFHPNTALFPAEIPADFNMDTFSAGFQDYLEQSIATLNNAAPEDFTPSLTTFDSIIQSVALAPMSMTSPATAAPTVPTATAVASLNGLGGVTWTLISYGDPAAPLPALDGTLVTLVFAESGASGNAGCNSYSGAFQYDNAAITFGTLTTTQIACDQPIMDQEAAYLNALASANSYVITGHQLQISYDGGVLNFSSTGSVTSVPLPGGSLLLSDVVGVTWTLTSLGDPATPTPALDGTPVTLIFSATGVSGSAGCNSYTGNFQFDNGGLSIGPLITTKIACDQPIMDQETAYVNALALASSYAIINNQLQIMYDGGVLTFDGTQTVIPALNVTPSVPGDLAGKTWTLNSYGDPASPTPVLDGTTVTLTFADTGAGGSAGCNSYGGGFQVNNNAILFGQMVTTLMACDQPIMDQETAYLDALAKATTYAVTGNQLQVNYDGGVLNFTAS